MGEWRFRWHVVVEWESSGLSPAGWGREHLFIVNSVADLRRIVERARKDPWVKKHSHWRELYYTDPLPAECRNGHGFFAMADRHNGSTTFHKCGCGGHWRVKCDRCGDLQTIPPVERLCEPEVRGSSSPYSKRR